MMNKRGWFSTGAFKFLFSVLLICAVGFFLGAVAGSVFSMKAYAYTDDDVAVNQWKDEATSAQRALADASAAKINADCVIAGHKTAYEKVRYYDEWLAENVVYKSRFNDMTAEHLVCSAYGALVRGEANCVGYARGFYALCGKGGVPALFACNSVGTHQWNTAKVDGKWYFVDACWDDAGDTSSRDWLLVGNDTTSKNRTHKSSWFADMDDDYFYEHKECSVSDADYFATPPRVSGVKLKKGKKGSRKVSVSWKSLSKTASYTTAYQVRYVNNGKKKFKTVSSSKSSVVLSKLKKGKKVSVKVRALYGSSYGEWSKTKSVKVR